jgi:hypothetical protein
MAATGHGAAHGRPDSRYLRPDDGAIEQANSGTAGSNDLRLC